jgi:undecaprenyl-diphosphatase
MTAFAVSVPVGLAYPLAAPWLMASAVLIAASRILLGMHFLSDVVAGSILGAFLGYLSFALFLV